MALLAGLCVAAAWGQTQPSARPAAPRPAAAGPSYKDLKFPPLAPVALPKIERSTLPNGMRLYLLEDHELPMVHGMALVRTGNLFDPADKIGLALMTGFVMRIGGTAAKTGEELDVQLEDVAARVESEIGETSGSVSFTALKESAPDVMGIFHDVLTAPEFRQDKIDLAKSQYRSAFSRRNDNPQSILGREFLSVIYGRDNPYGWEESYATLGAIARGDMLAFHKRYFFPKNVMLAVWGDFNAAEMKTQVEKLFAGWTAEQPEVPPFPKVTAKDSAGVHLAVKTDVTQTFFAIGQLGGEYRDKDYPALDTMAQILGGGFHSRLMEIVRTKMGNAYDISATWSASYDHAGRFEISGSTKTPSTVDTIAAALKEVDRLRTSEVSDEELRTARDKALNSLVFAFDTKSKSLGRMLTYEYFGYPPDFVSQYQKALEGVTRADILRVAKERLDPAKFAIVAVGNPNGFVPAVETLGRKVTRIDLTVGDAPAATAAQDAASLARGKALLAEVQQAVGGASKLAAVKDYVENAELDAVNPNIHVKQTYKWVAPNHWREENEYPGAKIAVYTDGATGWLSSGPNVLALAGPQAKQVNGDLFRAYVGLLLSDRAEGRTVNAIDANALEISDKNGNVARLIVDPATHLPKTLSYDAVNVTGAAPVVQENYSDFREVNGIKIPFRINLTQNGRPYADATVSDFKINTGLKREDLQKRQ
jgi:predicted Zn-dependent peptidase